MWSSPDAPFKLRFGGGEIRTREANILNQVSTEFFEHVTGALQSRTGVAWRLFASWAPVSFQEGHHLAQTAKSIGEMIA